MIKEDINPADLELLERMSRAHSPDIWEGIDAASRSHDSNVTKYRRERQLLRMQNALKVVRGES